MEKITKTVTRNSNMPLLYPVCYFEHSALQPTGLDFKCWRHFEEKDLQVRNNPDNSALQQGPCFAQLCTPHHTLEGAFQCHGRYSVCVDLIGKRRWELSQPWIELEGKGRGTPSEPYLGISYSQDRHHRTGGESSFHLTLTWAPTYCRAAGNEVGCWRRERREKVAVFPGPWNLGRGVWIWFAVEQNMEPLKVLRYKHYHGINVWWRLDWEQDVYWMEWYFNWVWAALRSLEGDPGNLTGVMEVIMEEKVWK